MLPNHRIKYANIEEVPIVIVGNTIDWWIDAPAVVEYSVMGHLLM